MTAMIENKWHRGVTPGAAILAFVLAGILFFGLSAGPAVAQEGFRVFLTPNRTSVELRPSARTMLSFRLTNNDEENPVRINVFLSDFRQGIRGQYLLTDTTMAYSCVSWMELQDTLIEISPGDMREVYVLVKVPARARGGAYGAVVFKILPAEDERPVSDQPLASTVYYYQMPAFVEISVARSGSALRRLKSGRIDVRTPETDSVLADNYGPDAMMVAAEIENTGNILVEARGQLIIRDENNRLVRRVPLGAGRGAILPGAKTFLRSIIQRLNPGLYSVRAIVQYGGHSPAVSLTSFEVSRRAAAQVGELGISIPLEIDIRPEELSFSAPQNAFRAFGATLINRESFPVAVDVSMGQIYHDVTGQLWTSPEADSGRALAGWVEYDPAEMKINPNRRKTVRLTLNVSDTAAGGYYGCLLFNARVADTADTAPAFLPTALSLPIYIEVPSGIEYAGEIVSMKIEETAYQGVTLRPVYRNTGNTHTTVNGLATIQMWSEDRAALDSLIVLSEPKFEDVGQVAIEVDSVLILPGEVRILSTQTVEFLPPGHYRAIVEIRCGPTPAAPTATLEKEFDIKPGERSM
jgi:hypothetical protein